MSVQISFSVNGEEITVEQKKGHIKLLSFLREELGLLGAKNGCAEGHCGTCTVLIDGQAKRACLWELEKLSGTEIETIENLSRAGELHPLQISFLEKGAVQCGFCTPGMIMAAKALLDRNLNPSIEEIKSALKRNICRCTGYQKVIEAVRLASYYLREGTNLTEFKQKGVFGKRVTRNDARAKVLGEPIYLDDYTRADLLYGKLHLSEEAHAKILAVDISRALAIEGVVKVLTADDIPGAKHFGLITEHQPVLAGEKVRYIGDPIALVLAESKEAVARGVEAIEVDYQPLTTYYTPHSALAEDALSIHQEGNLLSELCLSKGDCEQGFKEADLIVEGSYQTPFVEHAYLEPEGGLAEYDQKEERITVWAPSQSSHKYRDLIAASLDLNTEQIRVINTRTGGAFGGREEPTVQIHCALGALLTQRSVKMVLNRRESIRMSTKRHAAYLNYKIGATKEGKLVAAKAEIYTDTGAYASAGAPVAARATTFALGPYVIPNAEVQTKAVYTNNIPAGAMRGFGSPQVAFAAERHLDKLARKLGMDPLELRLKNALEEGQASLTGHVLGPGTGFKECLEGLREALLQEKLETESEEWELGVGIAAAYKNVGIGNALAEDNQAKLRLSAEGELILYLGCIDSGQGSDTAMAQIAAEVLGSFYQQIKVVAGDTDLIADCGVTTASRMSFLAGNAVKGCAERFKQRLLEELSRISGVKVEQIELDGDQFINTEEEVLISLQELAAKIGPLEVLYDYQPPPTQPLAVERIPAYPSREDNLGQVHFAYCYGAHAAIVRVHKESGDFEVLKIIAAHDVGRAINPCSLEGQIEGGVSMGFGYAVSEEFSLEEGWPVQNTLAKLALPKTTNMPEVESLIIEKEEPAGPYGVKGMSELPVSPVAPAIMNAIAAITGIECDQLPLRSLKIEK